jgi:hypothetical protein
VGFYGSKKSDDEEKIVEEKTKKSKHHPELWRKIDSDTFYCPMPNGIVMRYKNYSICFVPGVAVGQRKGEMAFNAC